MTDGQDGRCPDLPEPRKITSLASGLAVSGLPKVIEMLKNGDSEPIWNLSDAISDLLEKGRFS